MLINALARFYPSSINKLHAIEYKYHFGLPFYQYFITTGVDQIWKMRAIYHRFHDILTWQRGWSMVKWNDVVWATVHWATSFPGMTAQLCIHELTEKYNVHVNVRRGIWQDEEEGVLTKTERTESKNTQNILVDWFYLLFEEYPQERTCAYTLKLPKNTQKIRRKSTRK